MGIKRILITNDDGFEAAGLHALAEALSPLAELTIVAPTIEKSACGHSLTLTRPLSFIEVEERFYKLDDGTPSDCVFLALKKLYGDQKPDLVVSGINRGANMGEDITYSGTAAAAMEAVLQGVPAIAVSLACEEGCASIDRHGYTLAAETAAGIVADISAGGYPLPGRKFLNINIPPVSPSECRGRKITYAGHRMYGNDASVHINPRGREYYWIGLPLDEWRVREHGRDDLLSDFEAISENFVSITPIHLDMTAYDEIASLSRAMGIAL